MLNSANAVRMVVFKDPAWLFNLERRWSPAWMQKRKVIGTFGYRNVKSPSSGKGTNDIITQLPRNTIYHQRHKKEDLWPHPPRVLDDLDILLSKFVRIQFEEPLGDLRQRSELGLFVDVLLSIFILKEALQRRIRKSWTLLLLLSCSHASFKFPVFAFVCMHLRMFACVCVCVCVTFATSLWL